MTAQDVDVLVVGAGPSGLAAAIALRRRGVERVVVMEREQEPGGIPRHSHHIGFGRRDLHRFLYGPAYAARYVRLAERAGVEIRTGTTVTGWQANNRISTTSASGISEIRAGAIVLATGCRERPRTARLIPGTRPRGVFTTGALQQFVYIHHHPVGVRALVVGAEHVSFSAVMTLRHAGVHVVAMVTDLPRHQSFFQYKLISSDLYRVPVWTNMQVGRILGNQRVEAVELAHLATGETRLIDVDTVVFTGDWIPDHELARLGGIALNPGTRGPQVDQLLRTSVHGVFAVGNLLQGAETADVAALSGRFAAAPVLDYLSSGNWRDETALPVMTEAPVQWVSPNMIVPGQAQGVYDQFILRVSQWLARPTLVVQQGNRTLWQRHYRRLIPNLSIHIPTFWQSRVNAQGEPVTIRVR